MMRLKELNLNTFDKWGLAVCLVFAVAFAIVGASALQLRYDAEHFFFPSILSFVIISLGCIPFYFFLKGGLSKSYVPFLAAWGGLTALQYGYRYLVYGNYLQFGAIHLSETELIKVSLVTIAGMVSCYGGYYLVIRSKKVQQAAGKFNLRWDDQVGIKFAVYAGIIGLIAYAFETVGKAFIYSFDLIFPLKVQQPIHLLGGLPVIAITLLFIMQLQGKLSKKLKIFLWVGLIIPRMVLGILTGLSGNAIIVLFPLIFTYLTLKRRFPFALLAAFAILFVFGQLVVKSTDMNKNRDYLSVERYKAVKKPLNKDMILTGTTLLDRLGAHGVLGHAVHNIPAKAPYYKSQAYMNLVCVLIPRAIWSGKPFPVKLDELGGRILHGIEGHKLGMTLRPTQMGMLYVTWGPAANIIGMLLFGMAYGFSRRFTETLPQEKQGETKPGIDSGKLLLGVIIAAHLIDIEGDCFQVLARTIWPAIMVLVINLLLKRISKRRQEV